MNQFVFEYEGNFFFVVTELEWKFILFIMIKNVLNGDGLILGFYGILWLKL